MPDNENGDFKRLRIAVAVAFVFVVIGLIVYYF